MRYTALHFRLTAMLARLRLWSDYASLEAAARVEDDYRKGLQNGTANGLTSAAEELEQLLRLEQRAVVMPGYRERPGEVLYAALGKADWGELTPEDKDKLDQQALEFLIRASSFER